MTRLTAMALTLLAGASPEGGFQVAIESALPRVVKLYGLRVGMEAGYGSGVIVSPEGHVVTVYSLLIEAHRMRAVTADGTVFDAEVVHRDADRQLALLRLIPPPDSRGDEFADPSPDTTPPIDEVNPHSPGGSAENAFPYFDLSEEAALLPGDWILSAGNAFKVAEGDEPVSIAHGVFSARTRLDARRRVRDFPYHGDVLVMDAITSNPGAPGSAVVNLEGRFVGMVGREVVSNLTHTHFNYAIPRDVLREFFQSATSVKDGASFEAPEWASVTGDPAAPSVALSAADLGFRLSTVGYKRVLPFVEFVRAGSAAHQAGLRKDDLILSINGRSVAAVEEVEQRLGTLVLSDPITLVIRRDRAIVTAILQPEKP